MPNVRIVCVGKLKEKYLQMAQEEYAKRLSAFCRLEIVEKKEAALPVNPSAALIDKAATMSSPTLPARRLLQISMTRARRTGTVDTAQSTPDSIS